MRLLNPKGFFLAGCLLTTGSAVAQLASADYSGSTSSYPPGILPSVDLLGLDPGPGDFQDVTLKVGTGSSLTADYSFQYIFTFDSAVSQDTTVTVTVAQVVLEMLINGAGVSPQTFNLGPQVGSVVVPNGGTGGTVNFSDSYAFAPSLAGLTAGSSYDFTLNWGSTLPTIEAVPAKTIQTGSFSESINGTLTVPEPGEYALLAGLGLLGFAVWRNRRA